jgi:hypothetical protein
MLIQKLLSGFWFSKGVSKDPFRTSRPLHFLLLSFRTYASEAGYFFDGYLDFAPGDYSMVFW